MYIRTIAASILLASTLLVTPASAQIRHVHGDQQIEMRLERQAERIDSDQSSGRISDAQASRMREMDRSIRREEARMLSFNGGFLTADDIARLNVRLDRVEEVIATSEE